MTTENKLNNIKINEPYKIITVAYDIITTNDEGVVTSVKRHRNTFVPTDDVSAENQEIKDLATANWTDEIKTAYTTYMESLV